MGSSTKLIVDRVSALRWSIFNPRIGSVDPWLVGAVAVLCFFGLIMVWSASHLEAGARYGNPYLFVAKQSIALVVGALVLTFASRLRICWLERHIGWILAAVLVLLAVVPLVGVVRGGAARWIAIESFSFQPSELAKFAIVLYLARVLATEPRRVREFFGGFLRPLVMVGLIVGLILLQRNLSTAVIVCGVATLMLFVGGSRLSHMALLGGAALLVVAVGVQGEAYRSERVQAWLDPETHREGKAWQLWQSQIGFGAGGVAGVGLGNGEQKTGVLPAVHTDFIYSLVGEEFGILGAFLVIVLFAAIGVRGFLIAARHPDPFASLLAFGLTSLILMQAALHIGVTVGIFPTTGLVLPFVSYGGSALVVFMLEVGVLAALSRMAG